MKIMIADDNDFSTELLVSLIDRTDIEFVRAKDGDEAVSLFQNSKEGEIDIILMDIIMANKSGNEAADKIRSLDRSDASTVRIYATTALHGFDFQNRGSSFNGAIFKPFNKDAVNAILED